MCLGPALHVCLINRKASRHQYPSLSEHLRPVWAIKAIPSFQKHSGGDSSLTKNNSPLCFPLGNHGFVNSPLHLDRSCPGFVLVCYFFFSFLNNVLSSRASRSHNCLRPLDYRKQHQILIGWWRGAVGKQIEQMRSCP